MQYRAKKEQNLHMAVVLGIEPQLSASKKSLLLIYIEILLATLKLFTSISMNHFGEYRIH